MGHSPELTLGLLNSDGSVVLTAEVADCTDADSIQEAIDELAENAPEGSDPDDWRIVEREEWLGLEVEESDELEKIAEMATAIEEYEEPFALFADNQGIDFANEDGFHEAYCGEWDSEEAYAEHLFDECYMHDVPSSIQNYIDYAAFARDLFCGDYYSLDGEAGETYIFRSY